MKTAGSGQIVNISSISARTGGGRGCAHYVATKGGLEALTRALAKELGPLKIAVNAVASGLIRTRLLEYLDCPEDLERLRQNVPLARNRGS